METRKTFEISSFTLHMMAMVFMLCDHLWATVIPGNDWLTCIGRITFPLYAFMTVEGYFHTRDLKKYVRRLFLFALLSEIPFNLVMGSSIFYPLHQNVLFTFLIGIGLIHLNEKAKAKGGLPRRVLTGIATTALGALLGIVLFTDYYAGGVLMVLVFYFFRGRGLRHFLLQLICLAYINTEVLGGFGWDLQLFGHTFFFHRQAFALLALIPIWLYKGKQGPYSKGIQLLYYGFYPVHLLILALIRMCFI